MCVVSMVSDYWKDNNLPKYPNWNPGGISSAGLYPPPQVTREEFEALRKDVLELKELLKAAKKFDDATNQHDCEKEEKVELIKKIAEAVGVDLEDLLK